MMMRTGAKLRRRPNRQTTKVRAFVLSAEGSVCQLRKPYLYRSAKLRGGFHVARFMHREA